jgi:hypothetical protein
MDIYKRHAALLGTGKKIVPGSRGRPLTWEPSLKKAVLA